MKISCTHCKDETYLTRPNRETVFTIQCSNCKKYFYYAWNAQIKGSKPFEYKAGEKNAN